MRDRLPTPGRENRVKITQDDGTIVSGVLSYDDQATQEGSPYTKGNVLPDIVCNTLGLNTDSAEPKDAFLSLSAISGNNGMLVVQFLLPSGVPVLGGFITVNGQDVIAGKNGIASILLSPGQYTVTVTAAIDMMLNSESSFSATISKGQYTISAATVTEQNITKVQINASRKFCFSDRVSDFDLFAVAGGGSGAASGVCQRAGGACAVGGAGGETKTQKNISNSFSVLTAEIGAGGDAVSISLTSDRGGAEGKPGGNTTISSGDSAIISALGGEGGNAASGSDGPRVTAGGASGGSGSCRIQSSDMSPTPWAGYNGTDGESFDSSPGGSGQGRTTTAFEENTGTQYSPAGGSAFGYTHNGTAWDSGTDLINVNGGGVYGEASKTASRLTGNSATTPGGGGGGATITKTSGSITVTSGAGADGLAIVRWRYAT